MQDCEVTGSSRRWRIRYSNGIQHSPVPVGDYVRTQISVEDKYQKRRYENDFCHAVGPQIRSEHVIDELTAPRREPTTTCLDSKDCYLPRCTLKVSRMLGVPPALVPRLS